ncbi:MAG TPA: hypothetical protein VM432_10540 [Bdellovibrionales bacterium]|nr:hypothetical protein [Bdellovibrionales bacterium]
MKSLLFSTLILFALAGSAHACPETTSFDSGNLVGICLDHQGGAYVRSGEHLELLRCANTKCAFATAEIKTENYRGTVIETGIGIDLVELMRPIMSGSSAKGPGPLVFSFPEVALVCSAPLAQEDFDHLQIERRLEDFLK